MERSADRDVRSWALIAVLAYFALDPNGPTERGD